MSLRQLCHDWLESGRGDAGLEEVVSLLKLTTFSLPPSPSVSAPPGDKQRRGGGGKVDVRGEVLKRWPNWGVEGRFMGHT